MSRAAASRVTQNELDTPELEALFDSIAEATRSSAAASIEPGGAQADRVLCQLGQLTRKLHETLRELGYDRVLEDTAKAIPDARDRLAYIATLTEQAAERTLNAIEAAKPIQDRMGHDAAELAKDWDKLFQREIGVEAFKALAQRTRTFLSALPGQTEATSAQLIEIMMAQDFQDLTGQVIKRITAMAQDMEDQLLQLLVEHAPAERREAVQSRGLLNGPVTGAERKGDVVTSQSQVDELLDSLGF